MKQFKNIYFQFILSLILTATLVTGCVAPGPRPGKDSPDQAGTPAESPASYEKYEKATLETQEHFDQMMNDLFLEVNPIPVKAAMNMMGLDVGPMRLPLCEMGKANAATLRRTLEEAGLL